MKMHRTAVVTIASENYFAQVQVLLKSLMETNPQWDRFFAIVDEPDDDLFAALRITNTSLICMEELEILDLDDMKFRYDIMELNTAIKPFVMLKLMKDYDRVVYLDPDICVYGEMTAVNEAFDKGNHFVIIPHFTDYFDDDGKHPDEPDIMRAGIYNFGFFAADNSPDAEKAIKWWAGRLEKLCINKQRDGIFVDQKWMDLLPGRHDNICIIRNDGYNTAYWNLSQRKASRSDGKYYFNEDELVFFHFSGFNPQNPKSISKHQNRYSMSDIGVAKSLFYDYAKSTMSNEYDKWRQKKYSYDHFSDGREVKDIFRKLYRNFDDIEKRARKKNPFNCSSLFYDDKRTLAPKLINYAIDTHDGMGVFFLNSDRNGWVQWLEDVLRNEYKLDIDWVRYGTAFLSKHLSYFDNEKVRIKEYNLEEEVAFEEKADGINLIGYIKSEHGLGEACRLTADALSNTDIDWGIYDWEMNNPSRQNDDTWITKIDTSIKYNVSVFNINADQMPVAFEHLPKDAWSGYRIGIWYWELTKFPKQWMRAFDLVDEIWAPTRFIQENLKKVTDIPVLYMPPGIRRNDIKPNYNRDYFGLPEHAFLFLNYFDALSYSSRKNPEAAIKAFKESFQHDDNSVGMVIKLNNVKNDSESLGQLREYIGDYQNIYILSKTYTRDEINALIFCCDVSVSLHRSEGLGLLCEESMYYGKPVIATNWSGNTDFMTETTACLVDYTLVPIGDYYGTNEPDQKWAEADVKQASEYMKKLYSDREYCKELGKRARDYIRKEFSPEICSERMKDRFNEIIESKRDIINARKIEGNEQMTKKGDGISVNVAFRNANTFYPVNFYRELGGNSIKKTIKRIIRKIIGCVIKPMAEEQTIYNQAIVQIVNDMESRVENNTSEIQKINNCIFDLLNDIKKSVDNCDSKLNDTTINSNINDSVELVYKDIYARLDSIEKNLSEHQSEE